MRLAPLNWPQTLAKLTDRSCAYASLWTDSFEYGHGPEHYHFFQYLSAHFNPVLHGTLCYHG